VFGFSFGELVVLIIVGVVVLGPKELPGVLRKLGHWSGKLRRMASDIRAQSGIDEVLRSEGMGENIAEIRKLARGEFDQIRRDTTIDFRSTGPSQGQARPVPALAAHDPYGDVDLVPIVREREYPREGADSYRAVADTAIVYANTLPASPLATNALYLTGDEVIGDEVAADALPADASASEAPSAAPPTADALPGDA
jgi:sec-independent protein translocase protein TatB